MQRAVCTSDTGAFYWKSEELSGLLMQLSLQNAASVRITDKLWLVDRCLGEGFS